MLPVTSRYRGRALRLDVFITSVSGHINSYRHDHVRAGVRPDRVVWPSGSALAQTLAPIATDDDHTTPEKASHLRAFRSPHRRVSGLNAANGLATVGWSFLADRDDANGIDDPVGGGNDHAAIRHQLANQRRPSRAG